MRGGHDPAGVRDAGRRERGIAVLLSGRNPERSRHNRTRALPFSGLLRPVAVRGQARRNLENGRRALPAPTEMLPAKIRSAPPHGSGNGPGNVPGHVPGLDPLYLFACGLSWRKQRDAGAGWELVGCLKRSGQAARIAAALLAQAKDFELPAQDPAHSKAGTVRPPPKLNRQHRM